MKGGLTFEETFDPIYLNVKCIATVILTGCNVESTVIQHHLPVQLVRPGTSGQKDAHFHHLPWKDKLQALKIKVG